MSTQVEVGHIWKGKNTGNIKKIVAVHPNSVESIIEGDKSPVEYWGGPDAFIRDHEFVSGSITLESHLPKAKRERLDVMIDIESLSTAHNGATIQIAAVPFHIEEAQNKYNEIKSFNRKISPKSCIEAGLDVNADTMKWWFGQDEHVQSEVLGQAIMYGQELKDELIKLMVFLKDLENYADKVFIWGYPATSDMTWLQQAYLAAKLPYPVAYNRTRCLGTIADFYWEMYGEKLSDTPTTKINHDALVDCQSQIEMVVHAYKRLNDSVRI